jgi:hypothetical protein
MPRGGTKTSHRRAKYTQSVGWYWGGALVWDWVLTTKAVIPTVSATNDSPPTSLSHKLAEGCGY